LLKVFFFRLFPGPPTLIAIVKPFFSLTDSPFLLSQVFPRWSPLFLFSSAIVDIRPIRFWTPFPNSLYFVAVSARFQCFFFLILGHRPSVPRRWSSLSFCAWGCKFLSYIAMSCSSLSLHRFSIAPTFFPPCAFFLFFVRAIVSPMTPSPLKRERLQQSFPCLTSPLEQFLTRPNSFLLVLVSS